MRQLPHENVSKRRKSIAQVSLACLTDFNCIRVGKANYADEGPQRPQNQENGRRFLSAQAAGKWILLGFTR